MGWPITREQVLTAARKDLGLGESPDGSNHNRITESYGIGDGPWCAMGVWSWFKAGGVDLRELLTKEWAWTPSGALAGKRAGLWHDGTAGLTAGDIVYLKVPGGSPQFVNHVCIYDADGYTIDANWSNLVIRVKHPASLIVGYIRPPYTEPPSAGKPVTAKPFPPYPGVKLQRGSRGPSVKVVQTKLKAIGISVGLAGADGIFGDDTRAGVIRFQKIAFPGQPSEYDGIVGPKTWAALAAR
jgi:hypothetical protein